MEEIWKDVPDYEGLYKVSNLGRIMNKDGKIRSTRIHKNYACICLCKKSARKTVMVHTIVAAAFLGPRPTPDHQIDHIDGDRLNNKADNLEYVTRRENYMRMAQNQGRFAFADRLDELTARVEKLEKLLEEKDGQN